MVSIIVAMAENNVIGGDNKLLWHISEDLKRFKAITTGHPVVMGRKTWESLGRPLPNRENVVISRNTDFVAEGARVAASLDEAIALFPAQEEVFVIGGGEVYRQAMDRADRLYITFVEAAYDGDAFFPVIDERQWQPVFTEKHESGAAFPHPFVFMDYRRR